jgi:hypothetical protein
VAEICVAGSRQLFAKQTQGQKNQNRDDNGHFDGVKPKDRIQAHRRTLLIASDAYSLHGILAQGRV